MDEMRRAVLYGIEKLHAKYCTLRKHVSRVKQSPSFLDETAPFWVDTTENYLQIKLETICCLQKK
jgi:hypothetical protein